MQPSRIELESVPGSFTEPVQPPAHGWFPDAELETPLLPRDHPAWMRDAIAISAQARRWIARLQPIVLRALTFWDHAVRSIRVAGRAVSVDPAGCYRVD